MKLLMILKMLECFRHSLQKQRVSPGQPARDVSVPMEMVKAPGKFCSWLGELQAPSCCTRSRGRGHIRVLQSCSRRGGGSCKGSAWGWSCSWIKLGCYSHLRGSSLSQQLSALETPSQLLLRSTAVLRAMEAPVSSDARSFKGVDRHTWKPGHAVCAGSLHLRSTDGSTCATSIQPYTASMVHKRATTDTTSSKPL